MTLDAPPIPDIGDERVSATAEPDVLRELHTLKVRGEARRLYAAEQRAKVDPPEVLTLAERLARPRVTIQYRIDEWQPLGSRVVLAAQRKAGKTTLVGNLARSLADGKRFLGVAECRPVEGTVAILDFEMSDAMLDHWLEDQQIEHQERVVVIAARGLASTFDLRDDAVVEEWAARLSALRVEYLIIDCLRPWLDAFGLDESHDAGAMLTPLDALLTRAGISDALVVHHMGHTGERSRGDTRIRDWPEVEWKLVREDPDDDASPRYVSAYGRDVDQGETKLHFDLTTRHLTLAEGSRKDSAAIAALDSIEVVLMEASESMSARAIERALADTGHSREAIRRALKVGSAVGRLSAEPGPKRSTLYQCASARVFADSAPAHPSECASAPIEGAQRTHDLDGAVRGRAEEFDREVGEL